MLKWLSCTFYEAYAKEKCWQVLCWNISLVKGFIMNHLSFTLPSLVLPAILRLPRWERDSCQRDGFQSVIFFLFVCLSFAPSPIFQIFFSLQNAACWIIRVKKESVRFGSSAYADFSLSLYTARPIDISDFHWKNLYIQSKFKPEKYVISRNTHKNWWARCSDFLHTSVNLASIEAYLQFMKRFSWSVMCWRDEEKFALPSSTGESCWLGR